MPIIEMHFLEGRSLEDKARVAEKVTAAVVEALDCSPSTVRILITEHKHGEFYVAGKAGRASDQAAGNMPGQ
ncbi:MAG: 4-oxalocrotonate tautomerase [Oceanospirillaceae bacterium]|uniref:tautomerase family protein n=1 Tax=unclassified Thalassolituus TaxID=2624967 RepID=UPI000C0B9934|nr:MULTISPECIES: tautomerase family protein [unclassified Thalassolituus]MAK92783.1 4-oxalocrotonate tautomerase [Thalassolituus sp.]MAS24187.1 4-oxalocrotonate tautomerase [Oceanospirillaceae bacterium]MAY00969.1 4-oxalocrotonate tautomerase [Oceanospirillaceae bacterium]MBL34673.1 4-oxalocrotonate tautomerase [Oceanospirillaceae bacterium]MBS52457.1 4-oxalocrotonate tautomerase [Oceanospirillaceae bacterium]|tara:strand:+ start:157 stop:372 length:216 start_codon:yes stop_codon:yes gene_type:complete